MKFNMGIARGIGVSLVSAAMLVACAGGAEKAEPTEQKEVLPEFSSDRIRNDMAFLADDTLKGRDTDSPEYRIAANYMATQFANLGLKPAGDNGSYLQEVPFRNTTLVEGSASGSIRIGGETMELEVGKDFNIGSSSTETETSVSGDLVFMGYGISAPSLGHDDYAGVDVTGKIVIVVDGMPEGFPSDVQSALRGAKADMADAAGAVALVTLSNAELEKRLPMDRYQGFYSRPALRWTQPDGSGFSGLTNLKATARLSADLADKLAASAGYSMDEVVAAVQNGDAEVPVTLDATLTLNRQTEMGEGFTSPNVAAILPGSDPALAGEYVVISAHLDHVGESHAVQGDDKIFNGAMDNASGNAVMLEVARAFAAADKAPRRSIMFLAVTAEEKGLMGADFFANFPTVPQGSIVANVNLDMPILLYDFKDVVAFGAEHSTFQQIGERAAERAGITFAPDPVPEEGLFTRSDHFRFVEQGIPSIFLMVGFTAQDPEVNGEMIWKGFLRGNEVQVRNYHQPGDDMSQPFDWKAAERFALVNYLIIEETANADEAPKWNEGDIFGEYYGKK